MDTSESASDPFDRARRALRRFRPDHGFALRLLSSGDESCVFLAEPEGRGRVFVVKVASSRSGAQRLIRQAVRQRAVWPAMTDGAARVPQVFRILRDLETTIFAHVPGQSHAAEWTPARSEGLCRAAGEWLRAFHATTAADVAFDPLPMMGWLPAATPSDLLPRLHGLGQAAVGAPVRMAVLHGDFHGGNIITTAGASWSFDFENDKPGAALRDALFYLIDAARHGAPLASLGAALFSGLSDPTAAPVARFLECHAALAQLGRMPPQGSWGPNATAKAGLLRGIAVGEVSFLPS